ncbi:hypothetical protein C8Q80DRAFT_233881 [Daedaleopsis nitida]|nr:hypothetical protein C8Q80DRAFT_233881 [Daedaleopsis nitida]
MNLLLTLAWRPGSGFSAASMLDASREGVGCGRDSGGTSDPMDSPMNAYFSTASDRRESGCSRREMFNATTCVSLSGKRGGLVDLRRIFRGRCARRRRR